MDADTDEETFVLINLYNANPQTEQIKTIYELDKLLSDFCLDSNKKIRLAGDFNLFFDPSLEASGGKPSLKKNLYQNFCKYLNKTILLIFGEYATRVSNDILLEKNISPDSYSVD